ncbi:MAG: hypothetical protein U0869_08640 [Chloroflexota bacterium]
MTPDLDLDRELEAGLRDLLGTGPTRMPARVFDTVLARVDSQPQVRRSRLHPRYRRMTPTIKLLAAAMFLLTVGFATGAIWGQPAKVDYTRPPDLFDDPLLRASPAPDGTLAPTTSALHQLTDEWFRVAPAGSPPRLSNVLGWTYDGAYLTFEGTATPELMSTLEVTGPDELLVKLKDATPECAKGDAGRYRWALSPSGATLTIETIEDACAARASVFATTYSRVGCLTDQNSCLGPVDAGTHGSAFFDAVWPRWQSGWAGVHAGSLTYTVPDGWAAVWDFPHQYALRPAAVYAEDIDGWAPGIWVLSNPAVGTLGPTCEVTKDDSISAPRLATEIEAWAVKQPGIVASKTGDTTVDGHPATWVDLELAPGVTSPCTDDPTPQVGLYTNYLGPDVMTWTLGPGRERHLFIDVDGTPVIVVLSVKDAATFDDFVAQAMPIVESFRFSPAG